MPPAHATPLDTLAGEYRPFLIFAPDRDNRLLRQQLNIVERNLDGFKERDMAVVVVYPEAIDVVLGPPVDVRPDALRDFFESGSYEFMAVLVGKDTQAKHRSETPYSAPALFAVIDAMPMRESEMGRDPIRR